MTRLKREIDVLLGVTGSIAAYKAVEIARLFIKQQRNVQVLMTPSARRFVGAATFAGITGREVYTELFASSGELHVELAQRAQRILVAPATADVLARFATGRADDLLTATLLCSDGPITLAPAMHPRMWQHPATQHNVRLLRERGVDFVGPAHGAVASGDVGWGRLAEPADIVAALSDHGSLAGRRLVVSAGPTLEDIDPVRFIGNRSSGKMGFAIAARAAARGAEVDLICGPVTLPTPPGVRRTDVRTALQMQSALRERLQHPADAVIMAAAVGDYRAASVSPSKLKRDGAATLELVENPDIISGLAKEQYARRPLFIAFAVETGDDSQIESYARDKLQKKGVDAVVANAASEAFGKDDNRAQLITASSHTSLPTMSKARLADAILDWLNDHGSQQERQ